MHLYIGDSNQVNTCVPSTLDTHSREDGDTLLLLHALSIGKHAEVVIASPDTDVFLLIDGPNIWLKSTKSGPVGFEKIDFSPCSMQWVFQTPGVSIVHVQKTVSYNTL